MNSSVEKYFKICKTALLKSTLNKDLLQVNICPKLEKKRFHFTFPCSPLEYGNTALTKNNRTFCRTGNVWQVPASMAYNCWCCSNSADIVGNLANGITNMHKIWKISFLKIPIPMYLSNQNMNFLLALSDRLFSMDLWSKMKLKNSMKPLTNWSFSNRKQHVRTLCEQMTQNVRLPYK